MCGWIGCDRVPTKQWVCQLRTGSSMDRAAGGRKAREIVAFRGMEKIGGGDGMRRDGSLSAAHALDPGKPGTSLASGCAPSDWGPQESGDERGVTGRNGRTERRQSGSRTAR